MTTAAAKKRKRTEKRRDGGREKRRKEERELMSGAVRYSPGPAYPTTTNKLYNPKSRMDFSKSAIGF